MVEVVVVMVILMVKVAVGAVGNWRWNSISAKKKTIKDQSFVRDRRKSPFPVSGEAILSRKCQEIRLDQNHQHLASSRKVFFYRLFPLNNFSG